MANLETVIDVGSIIAAFAVTYFALRVTLIFRGGKIASYYWWTVASAFAWSAHMLIYAFSESTSLGASLTHLLASVLLAVGLWHLYDFWKGSKI